MCIRTSTMILKASQKFIRKPYSIYQVVTDTAEKMNKDATFELLRPCPTYHISGHLPFATTGTPKQSA